MPILTVGTIFKGQLGMEIKSKGNPVIVLRGFFMTTMSITKISYTLLTKVHSLLLARNVLVSLAFICATIAMYIGTTIADD